MTLVPPAGRRLLTAFVPGLPKTQGSTRAFVAGGRARITADNTSLAPWREAIVTRMLDAMERSEWVTTDLPVKVFYQFWLPRPQSAPKTTDVLPKKGLDLDKLVRAANDAMTNAGVWTDDSRVVSSAEDKRYAVGPHLPKIYVEGFHVPVPGLRVSIMELTE